MAKQVHGDMMIQWKQKILHYRSEIARLTQLLENYEKKCQEKDATVQRLKRELEIAEQEKNEALQKTTLKPFAFFHYATFLNEKMILGNFIVENTGNIPLSSPVICLRISPKEAGKINGKIRFPNEKKEKTTASLQVYDDLAMEQWTWLDENWYKNVNEKGEYWLKASHVTTLWPNEQLRFTNFEFTLNEGQFSRVTIDGYVYFPELPEGIRALNQITIL